MVFISILTLFWIFSGNVLVFLQTRMWSDKTLNKPAYWSMITSFSEHFLLLGKNNMFIVRFQITLFRNSSYTFSSPRSWYGTFSFRCEDRFYSKDVVGIIYHCLTGIICICRQVEFFVKYLIGLKWQVKLYHYCSFSFS